MDDLLTLIAERVDQNEIGAFVSVEIPRDVWVRIESVGRSEWYQAGMAGLQPEVVAITNAANYNGEKLAELGGKRYAIYRTYRLADSDEVELYLSEQVGVR